jgi:UDPglucose 6-dehydrogenase/GDP-mannose 6-dehydrogenase
MKVAVFGAGYVGLVSGVGLSALGHEVVCVDVDAQRVARIAAGEPPIHEPGLAAMLKQGLDEGRFRATLDPDSALDGAHVSMLAVGTPDRDGRIDLRYVIEAARTIGAHLRKHRPAGHVVVVKSTVVPGSTVGPIRSALEDASGLNAGADFGLAMNPEFLREGFAVADFMDPDHIVVGAWDGASAETVEALYVRFRCTMVRLTPTEAEITKYASNALLATLISFSNEIFALCEGTPGASGRRVLEALHLDRRLSPRVDGKLIRPDMLGYLMGGIGYGGSCLPKDLNAITAMAQDRGSPAGLLEAAIRVNRARPEAILQRLTLEVGALAGQTIAVLGLAFKPGTDDWRESPSLPLIDALLNAGAKVHAWDPLVGGEVATRFGGRVLISREADAALRGVHAAVIATAWPELASWPWQRLLATMARPCVFDGRNVLAKLSWPEEARYIPIGEGPQGGP